MNSCSRRVPRCIRELTLPSLWRLQTTLQSMIPPVVQVLQQALEANDEPAAKSIFEFFDTISLSVRPLLHSLETGRGQGD